MAPKVALRRPAGAPAPMAMLVAAKAKAKAKAKALVRRRIRPKAAAAKAGVRRRGAGEAGGGPSPWRQGKEVALHTVAIGDLEVGQEVSIEKAFHYAQEVKVAGTLKKLDLEGGGVNLFLKLSGTTGEEALKAHGADPSEPFQIHVCPPDCGRLETGERLLHGLRGRLLVPGVVKEDWMSNLVGGGVPAEGDELAALRERGALLTAADRVEAPKKKGGGSSSESKSKKKKKKKEKEKKKTKESEEAAGEERKKDTKRSLDGRHPRIAVQKRPQVLFEGTGLDVKEKIRNRVMTRARKFVSKKRERSSSSSRSSSTSNSTEEQGSKMEGLYLEVNKARAVAERFPAILSFETLQMMQESLLTNQGEDKQDLSVRPVPIQYYRQEISKRASGALAREMLTLATAIDHVVRGRPASACDVLCQRLKSCESMAHGTTWQIAQKMEIPLAEQSAIAHREELHSAQKETYQDAKISYLAKGKGKGKEKGGKSDYKGDYKGDRERGKGKDQDAKKDDKRKATK